MPDFDASDQSEFYEREAAASRSQERMANESRIMGTPSPSQPGTVNLDDPTQSPPVYCLPCPFCGCSFVSANRVSNAIFNSDGQLSVEAVFCSRCGTRGPEGRGAKEARRLWNDRRPKSSTPETLGENRESEYHTTTKDQPE